MKRPCRSIALEQLPSGDPLGLLGSNRLRARIAACKEALVEDGKREVVRGDVDPVEWRSGSNRVREPVFVNIAGDPVERGFRRGMIDLAQKMAAERFRELWERAGAAGARGIDPTRAAVDGGDRDPVSLAVLQALTDLARARAEIGARAYDRVRMFAGEGRSATDIALAVHGTPTMRDREFVMVGLREALSDLAALWGIAGRRRPIHRRAGQRLDATRVSRVGNRVVNEVTPDSGS
jgi:hypothetical protein